MAVSRAAVCYGGVKGNKEVSLYGSRIISSSVSFSASWARREPAEVAVAFDLTMKFVMVGVLARLIVESLRPAAENRQLVSPSRVSRRFPCSLYG
jgi:hypothetical protein